MCGLWWSQAFGALDCGLSHRALLKGLSLCGLAGRRSGPCRSVNFYSWGSDHVTIVTIQLHLSCQRFRVSLCTVYSVLHIQGSTTAPPVSYRLGLTTTREPLPAQLGFNVSSTINKHLSFFNLLWLFHPDIRDGYCNRYICRTYLL